MSDTSEIVVDERVNKRHPDITEANVEQAMKLMLKYMKRPNKDEFIAVGIDDKTRMLEMVYKYDEFTDVFFVWYSQKATTKTLKELDLI